MVTAELSSWLFVRLQAEWSIPGVLLSESLLKLRPGQVMTEKSMLVTHPGLSMDV